MWLPSSCLSSCTDTGKIKASFVRNFFVCGFLTNYFKLFVCITVQRKPLINRLRVTSPGLLSVEQDARCTFDKMFMVQFVLEVSRFLKNATPTPGDSCEKVDLTRLLAIPLKESAQPYR